MLTKIMFICKNSGIWEPWEIDKYYCEDADKGSGLTQEASFWSHGGYDAPLSDTCTSGDFVLDNNTGINQLSPEGWSNINWNFDSQNSLAAFYGCNTASFAQDFFDYSNVAYTPSLGGQASP